MARYELTRFCENMNLMPLEWSGEFDIPVIKPEKFIEYEYIPFNYAKTITRRDCGVHFFIHDYQFERVWREWKKYGAKLSEFEAVMTPDFSTYTDYPKALQIYNHYRKHFIGAYLQTMGVRVYPTISWSDESSFNWCFDGEPVGGTVCVSSVGTQKHAESKRLFAKGYDAMCERLQPETVIFYGNIPDKCKGNIIRIKPFQDKFREVKVG